MNRINQITVFFGCQFLLGALVAISPPKLASQTVVDTLPPLQLNKSKQPPALEEVFVPRDLDFRVPDLAINQKFDSYLVYIDDANSTQLEQIKQTIPTAFRKQLQGKFVIQAGVFSKESNATSLAQKLQALGITPHLFNLTTATEVKLNTDKSKLYSVVVPTITQD
jgi:SPOR domain